MRPCCFQSRSVARCISTSSRLWTCIRSIRSARSRAIERFIDSIPACLPCVQTLVAKKSFSRIPSAAVRSPITCSARPYIGDVSITRPPSFTNKASTSSNCRRLSDARSTSNVRHVPNPIADSFSSDEGIARINIADDSFAACARAAPLGRSKPPAPAVINRAASRRVRFSLIGRLLNKRINLRS